MKVSFISMFYFLFSFFHVFVQVFSTGLWTMVYTHVDLDTYGSRSVCKFQVKKPNIDLSSDFF